MYLGVDGGQTGTRGVLVSRDGTILATAESGGMIDAVMPGGVERMRAVLTDIRDTCAQQGQPEAVFLGLTATVTGTPSQGLGEAVAAELWPGSLRRVEGDSLIAWAAGTGGAPGVTAMAGTGSVVAAVNEAGETVEAGGWGFVFGDWGSGWHMGATAVRHMVQRWDRDRGTSALGKAICAAMGVASASEIPPRFYAAEIDIVDVARLAEVVARFANDGDEDAVRVVAECGATFGYDVANAIARLQWSSTPVKVAMVGRAFGAGPAYVRAFEDVVVARSPQPVEFSHAVLSTLGGAALLALGLGGIQTSPDLVARLAAQGLGAPAEQGSQE
jgi:N-acetylglucosamine kinase-like BadF-type ATPase